MLTLYNAHNGDYHLAYSYDNEDEGEVTVWIKKFNSETDAIEQAKSDIKDIIDKRIKYWLNCYRDNVIDSVNDENTSFDSYDFDTVVGLVRNQENLEFRCEYE